MYMYMYMQLQVEFTSFSVAVLKTSSQFVHRVNFIYETSQIHTNFINYCIINIDEHLMPPRSVPHFFHIFLSTTVSCSPRNFYQHTEVHRAFILEFRFPSEETEIPNYAIQYIFTIACTARCTCLNNYPYPLCGFHVVMSV